MKFLFWNIQKKPLGHLVRALVDEHDIDMVILAEVETPRTILDTLNAGLGQRTFHTDPLPDTVSRRGGRRPFVFWRLRQDAMRLRLDVPGAIFLELKTTSHPSVLVVAVHLPSPLHTSGHDRLQGASRVGKLIRNEEARLGHQRTLVVGDFNMNPFDEGVMTSDAFHAVTRPAGCIRRRLAPDPRAGRRSRVARSEQWQAQSARCIRPSTDSLLAPHWRRQWP